MLGTSTLDGISSLSCICHLLLKNLQLWHVVCHFGCIFLGFNYQREHEGTNCQDSYRHKEKLLVGKMAEWQTFYLMQCKPTMEYPIPCVTTPNKTE